MKTIKVVFGITVAFATGVLFGVLFAPESGHSTRKRVIQKGSDLANALNDRLDERFEELTGALKEQLAGQEEKTLLSQPRSN